jgi:hypothetical protein
MTIKYKLVIEECVGKPFPAYVEIEGGGVFRPQLKATVANWREAKEIAKHCDDYTDDIRDAIDRILTLAQQYGIADDELLVPRLFELRVLTIV